MPQRAQDLRDFLRTKREKTRPAAVGLTTYPGRRVPGLRREEVAQLAGMSVDYYTRLEQGRLTTASEGVVFSLAEALRLTAAETHYLQDLLRPPRARPVGGAPARPAVRAGLAALMAGLVDQPAFVLGPGAEVLASNLLLDALLVPFNKRPVDDRNLLRWMLLDPRARTLYLDWAQVTSEVVGVLRGEAVRHPRDAAITALISELSAASPEFNQWWEEHRVVERTWGSKRFAHPAVGRIDINYEALTLPGDAAQVLFVYTAKSQRDRDALRILDSWAADTAVPAGSRTATSIGADAGDQ